MILLALKVTSPTIVSACVGNNVTNWPPLWLSFPWQPEEGSIPLSDFKSQSVRPVKMDSCARPFTFELVSRTQQEEDTPSLTKSVCLPASPLSVFILTFYDTLIGRSYCCYVLIDVY